VTILYVYQSPYLAWEFVQARELQEGATCFQNDSDRAQAAAGRIEQPSDLPQVCRLPLQPVNGISVDLHGPFGVFPAWDFPHVFPTHTETGSDSS
jgi:hypothetical protein